MVGTKQNGILSSSAKNVVVEDQGFRKTLNCQVAIVNRESPTATAAGRQGPVINGASHAQEMRIEAPSTWVQDRDLAISRAPYPGDGEGQNLGFHNPMKKTVGDIRLPSSSLGPSGIHKSGSGHGSPDPVDGNDCSQVLVGAGFQSSDPGVLLTVTESSNTPTEPETVAGGSELTLNGSGYDTPDPIVGGNGGRLLDAVVGVSKLVTATTRKDNDLPTPMKSSRRGKVSGSYPLYGSDKSVEQDAEDVDGFFRPSIERNMYNRVPLPMNGDLSHTEHNGRIEVEMEAVPRGIGEVRNRGNSNSGIMGNIMGNVVKNVDSSPVKSWKNLFSVPNKTNGQLRYSKPHRTDGKIVVKPPEEAVMEGIDMWKGFLVGQFLDKRLPFPVVRSLVNKLWGKKEMPDISTTENGLYFFSIQGRGCPRLGYGIWSLASCWETFYFTCLAARHGYVKH